ncbi:hypothetical protein OH76DRAFT_1012062 [Lentinus brumalis]|uniref:Uncharacterized protein n=1 Tax=Lentinus brumalis TaxID=2498619 RepID=A0A371CYD6_9APHY|nr:hypothetical protein OH76DRAFT_1012062 [Polyporus brumalis]
MTGRHRAYSVRSCGNNILSSFWVILRSCRDGNVSRTDGRRVRPTRTHHAPSLSFQKGRISPSLRTQTEPSSAPEHKSSPSLENATWRTAARWSVKGIKHCLSTALQRRTVRREARGMHVLAMPPQNETVVLVEGVPQRHSGLVRDREQLSVSRREGDLPDGTAVIQEPLNLLPCVHSPYANRIVVGSGGEVFLLRIERTRRHPTPVPAHLYADILGRLLPTSIHLHFARLMELVKKTL